MQTKIKKQLEALKGDVEALAYMVNECNAWDGSLDSYEIHEFDDEFFSTYFDGKEPMEICRATFFGEIHNWNDEYIRFNGYGNLESLSEYDREKELLDGADEIVERFIELAEAGKVKANYVLEQF